MEKLLREGKISSWTSNDIDDLINKELLIEFIYFSCDTIKL